jgi:putative ABC transport system permease protein
MLFRYAWRELRNSPKFAWLFVLNLALGLVGFIALDSLKRSFSERLQASARSMLTADVSIAARRPFQAAEIEAAQQVLPAGSVVQTLQSLYSMVTSPERSVLVELRAVASGYPFYGQLKLEKSGIHEGTQPLALQDAAKVWVSPELLIQLNTAIGQTLKIGDREFVVDDVIVDDSASALVGNSMAPRLYVGLDQLDQAGLLKFGATVRHARLIRLPSGTDLRKVEADLKGVLKDPGVGVTTYREAGQDNGRMLSYLTDYLGLVSLVALALAAIGASFLFRVYLDRKQTAIATLVSLGMTHRRSIQLYVVQLAALGLLSALVASGLSMLLLPLGAKLLGGLTPLPIEAQLSWPSYGLALLLGTLGAILVCLPLLMKIRDLNPSLLFQESSSEESVFTTTNGLPYLPSLLAFYGLAVWQAHSWKVGSLFALVLAVIVLVFIGASLLLLKAASHVRRDAALSTRLAATYLRSHRTHTISALVALGVGSALINLIPQIQYSIQSELQRPEGDKLPSLFLFDIQDDQVQELEQKIRSADVLPNSVSPMIMARLTAVNDANYTRSDETETFTREGEQEQRFRNRGVNLSYRDRLALAESVVEGQFFSGPYDPTQGQDVQISLEERYAKRMGLKLGDKLTFDVQGLPIEGRVTSLRSVKWNTFQPNFFILLQPGSVDDAPKTFLMTLPELGIEKKVALQRSIVERFPNVSILDVSALVNKVSDLVEQMGLVLILMGWLTVLTGNVVIFSIAHQQALSRRWDHNLMKILGAELSLIMRTTLKEFAWLGTGAAVLGGVLGLAASFVLSKGIFESIWQPSPVLPLLMALLLLAVCLSTSFMATRRILKQSPSLQLDE